MKTIVQGQEWHKECYDRANPAKGPSRGLGAQLSRCPGCHQDMVIGQDSGIFPSAHEEMGCYVCGEPREQQRERREPNSVRYANTDMRE